MKKMNFKQKPRLFEDNSVMGELNTYQIHFICDESSFCIRNITLVETRGCATRFNLCYISYTKFGPITYTVYMCDNQIKTKL